MILGTGIDLVEVERIRAMREKQGERFMQKCFTPGEVAYCLERKVTADLSFAARFAAKEAAMKALGTGWAEGVSWQGIEVVREGDGAPTLVLHGKTKERADAMGVTRAHLSLTHTDRYASAQVILEGPA